MSTKNYATNDVVRARAKEYYYKHRDDPEKIEQRRANSKAYYEKHKNDEKYKERQRGYTRKFNEKNREYVALRSRVLLSQRIVSQ